jgi:hypothetical protein
MSMTNINRMLAYAGEGLSRTSVRFHRSLGRYVIGDDPAVTNLVYKVTDTPAANVQWLARFEDHTPPQEPRNLREKVAQWMEQHVPFPAYYSRAAFTEIDRGVMEDLRPGLEQDDPGIERGIAWEFGRDVMFGAFPEGQDFPQQYGMRLPAGGQLRTTPAFRDTSTNQLTTPESGVRALGNVDEATVAFDSIRGIRNLDRPVF